MDANETRVGGLKKKVTYILLVYIGAFCEQCVDDVCLTISSSQIKCRGAVLYVIIARDERYVCVG